MGGRDRISQCISVAIVAIWRCLTLEAWKNDTINSATNSTWHLTLRIESEFKRDLAAVIYAAEIWWDVVLDCGADRCVSCVHEANSRSTSLTLFLFKVQQ